MSLKIQILTLLVSLGYGLFFGATMDLNYKFMKQGKTFYTCFLNFLFIIFHILLYFFILQNVNHGIIHPYALLMLFIGVMVEHFTYINIKKLIARNKKKWYNFP